MQRRRELLWDTLLPLQRWPDYTRLCSCKWCSDKSEIIYYSMDMKSRQDTIFTYSLNDYVLTEKKMLIISQISVLNYSPDHLPHKCSHLIMWDAYVNPIAVSPYQYVYCNKMIKFIMIHSVCNKMIKFIMNHSVCLPLHVVIRCYFMVSLLFH